MKYFYFGASQKQLFGIYHPPHSVSAQDCGIVLCYPMGHEYLSAHRAFRQLALHLSRSGFHVLRFDYFGCGDSAGNSEEGDINQWINDISKAVDEIKDLCNLTKVSLVGLRLGATLSALAGTQRPDIENIVLWEPVINGKGYIEELEAIHQDLLQDSLPEVKHPGENNRNLEILGFPLTGTMRDGLEKIDLLTLKTCSARNIFIIESDKNTGVNDLQDHLKNIHVHLDYQLIPGPKVWLKERSMSKPLVPSQILQSIVSWFSKVCL